MQWHRLMIVFGNILRTTTSLVLLALLLDPLVVAQESEDPEGDTAAL